MTCTHCQQEQAERDGLCGPCSEIEPDMAPIPPTEKQMEEMFNELVKNRIEDRYYAKHHAQGCR